MRMIDDFPRKVSEAELPLQECQNRLRKLREQYEILEKKKREKERALEDSGEKIRKLKARTGEIKTNKEYQALLKEIEAAERERSTMEDDILVVMEDSDAVGRQLKGEEQNYKKSSEAVDVLKRKLHAEKAALEKDLLDLKGTRAKVAGDIDSDMYNQYIMLIEIYHGHAVSEVKDEICQGCNMNIPPQLFVEIKKNEEIYQCPQCRRILFFRESTREGDVSPVGNSPS